MLQSLKKPLGSLLNLINSFILIGNLNRGFKYKRLLNLNLNLGILVVH